MSGRNELTRRGKPRGPGELAGQFTQPLALLLAVAAVLAWVTGTPRLGIAILAVIILNAAFAFAQELQAERAVEALAAFMPEQARIRRDAVRTEIDARQLVPGDILLIEEGERICADARLIAGSLEVDMSTLTGESVPVDRSAEPADASVPLLQATDLVFSGTSCTAGEAEAVATATGMRTELGRIAALSQRTGSDQSPLERQIKRATRLIAYVAIGAGLAFLPIGLAAGPGLDRGRELCDRSASRQRARGPAAHHHARARRGSPSFGQQAQSGRKSWLIRVRSGGKCRDDEPPAAALDDSPE